MIIEVTHRSDVLDGWRSGPTIMTITYEGDVLPNLDWQPPHTLRISTNDRYQNGFRILEKRKIVSIDGKSYKFVEFNDDDRKLEVRSSDGTRTYIVSRTNGHYECTCPGFHFRNSCSHLKLLG